jgi:hypothetical protein
MPQSSTTSAATSDVIEDVQQAPVQDEVSQPPVLITEQEVAFSTAVALAARPASRSRRLIDAARTVREAFRLPPPKKHLPQSNRYLEHSRMAREMDRL